jgi:alpha-1,3-mannosyltransferase
MYMWIFVLGTAVAGERPECIQKYSPSLMSKMAAEISGHVAIVALLRDSERILPHFERAVLSASHQLGEHRVFVSILESASKDGTAHRLSNFQRRLQGQGIAHSIKYGNPPGLLHFVPGNPASGNRIEFLATLRNAALGPVLTRERVVSKVAYLNDVILCGGDILRLLSHDVDMACAYDFNGGGNFWDNWVYEELEGSRNALKAFERTKGPDPLRNEDVVPVVACWNGAVAFRAQPLYEGLRFRRGFHRPNDCAQSECSLFCLDLRKRGYTRIIADPTVQVFYQQSSLKQLRMLSGKPREPLQNFSLPVSWRCCELLDNGQKSINWNLCRRQLLGPLLAAR